MKKSFCSILFVGVATVTLVGLLTACESGSSSSSGDPQSAAGTWNGTGNYVHNNVPITQFNLVLNQDGNAVRGTYAIKRDARELMTGRVTGSVSGDRVDLTMTPHGRADGKIKDDRMELEWFESGFGGADWTGPRNGFVTLNR